MKKAIVIVCTIIIVVFLSGCAGSMLNGTYQNINPDKGCETTITFDKDGTLVWTEKYNIFGDKTFTFYGTYYYDENQSCYYLDVKAGNNILSKDTTFTMVKSSNNHLIIDGGTLDNADFKRN